MWLSDEQVSAENWQEIKQRQEVNGERSEPCSSYVVQLINCPISQFKLLRWLRTGYLGSSTADPRSNDVVNSNHTSLIRAIARACPTSKGGSVDHQNHDFLTVHRHSCESKTRSCVWGCVWAHIYVCIYYDKCDNGTGGKLVVKRSHLVIARLLVWFPLPSVFLHFLASRFE